MSTEPVGGRLAEILTAGTFAVTGEIVPPRAASSEAITEHARGLVGYVDAVHVTDNPTASAHMTPVAGARFVHEAGIEPTLQITSRDRNRLGLTADLLGAWALGARNVFCLTGDPIHIGDHPDAKVVADIAVEELVALARRMRDEGLTSAGAEIADPPRYLIGVADVPLADPYDPAKLEAKLEAGADWVTTQITYDLEALSAWADGMRERGLFERAKILIGVTPLRSVKQARFMDERLPGVRVPPEMLRALQEAGQDAREVGLGLTTDLVHGIKKIAGVAGVHVMGIGDDAAVREVVSGAGMFPRPT
jgi:methylenetetrahydrofolate reductase (NADPH)